MKPQDQVCSFEQAKRLKELGVKQESLFYWWRKYDGEHHLCYGIEPDDNINTHYSAFTVAELGEVLPLGYMLLKLDEGFVCADLDSYIEPSFGYFKTYANPAECAAAMLIYLLENNLTHA